MAVVMSRVRDQVYAYLSNEEKETFKSYTRQKRKKKANNTSSTTESLCMIPNKKQARETPSTDDNMDDNMDDRKPSPLTNASVMPLSQLVLGSLHNSTHKLSSSVASDKKIDDPGTSLALGVSKHAECFTDDPDIRFKCENVSLANNQQTLAYFPRVCIFEPNMEYNLWTSSLEFYSLKDLRHKDHSFVVGSPPPSLMTCCSVLHTVPQEVSIISDDVTILRSNHTIFQECFSSLRIDFGQVIEFVLTKGCANETRDDLSSVTARAKCRLDFGCAGQDSKLTAQGHYAPSPTYGLGKFESISDENRRNSLKKMIGDVFDAMQICYDRLEMLELNNGRPYNHQPRTDMYGNVLAQYFGAKYMRGENCTIQLKCLDRGDQTMCHKDIKNCTWVGYDKTQGLCFVLVDGKGTKWSLKFLMNSRDVIGNYFTKKVLGFDAIKTRIKWQLEEIDRGYDRFLEDRFGPDRPVGGLLGPPGPLKHNSFTNFFLDEHCGWKSVEIDEPGKITIERIELPTAIVRDYWLSAPATILFQLKETLKLEQLMELCIMAAYQTGFHRFYYIGSNYQSELASSTNPSRRYFDLSKQLFGGITGDVGSRRISPPGINFESVFIGDDGNMNNVMATVVKDVLQLLEWINSNVGSKPKFTQHKIEEKFRSTIKNWAGYRCEIGEFRLMLAVQLCVLCGIVIKPHPNLRNMVYPVATLGAAKQLQHLSGGRSRESLLELILTEFKLDEWGLNCPESLLCETAENRVTLIKDYFFKYQSLHTLAEDGFACRKEYGSTVWKKIH